VGQGVTPPYDSSHQSFCKLKSVTLTPKTGLGGVQNNKSRFLCTMFFLQTQRVIKKQVEKQMKKDANDSDGETDIED
jgi:hypothetical protein